MAASPLRPDRPSDPTRSYLVEVRRGLLRLHKALIDSERAVFERERGALTSGQLLQALIDDPFFEWLRPFSGLIVEMDEVLATREPVDEETARGFVGRVRALVATDEEESSAGGGRYETVVHRDPDVLVAHVELTGRLQRD